MNRVLPFLALCLILSFAIPRDLSGQARGHVEGEVIVMLKANDNVDRQSALEQLTTDFQLIELQEVKAVSERYRIHLFSYRAGNRSDESILSDIRAHPGVQLAQFNHYISLRDSVPSDQFFDQQWNMHNTGQTGGEEDADIDGPEAWSYTTGGFSALGDTLIIAIVDDGFDIDHGDLRFWKNYHDIPGNSIDDDTNGYVDDYHGWNSYTNNGEIIERDHGTHVTGIAAARGNNDMGVTGVNWNARVLPVCGSSTTELPVVEAYTYILDMRTRYNETNGEGGALIVATNASFGVDYGQPEDFPIWGLLYDLMGKAGIVSAAATSNSNINVDEQGDIPTAFPSDYLITVTNTTSSDVKYTSAGYGLKSIDLGAPGSSIYSTKQTNSYGLKSGTSMASPHVAGAIALLFSAADEAFMEAYQADPAGMALVIKQYLLNGTDELPTLVGVTVTGGRLNLYNSIRLMKQTEMDINPMVINMTLSPDSSFDASFSLMNTGGSAFDYFISYPDTLGWISIASTGGNLVPDETAIIGIDLNTSGLAFGTYITFVDIEFADSLIYSLPVRIDVDTTGSDFYLDLTLQSFEVGPDEGSVETVVSSNTNWVVADTSSWLSAQPQNGSGDDTITIFYDYYDLSPDRTGTVNIVGGGILRIVTITQTGRPPYIAVSVDTVYLDGYEGSYKTVQVLSNSNWYASSSDNWLLVSPLNGSFSKPLILRALSTNEEAGPRTGTATVIETGGVLTGTVTVIQSSVAGVAEWSLSDRVGIYPNPSKGLVTIDLTGIDEKKLNVRLMDPVSRTLLGEYAVSDEKTLHINVTHLKPGLYFVLVTAGERQAMKKLVIR